MVLLVLRLWQNISCIALTFKCYGKYSVVYVDAPLPIIVY